MSESKRQSVIIEAHINTPTYKNEIVKDLSFVNFFFGNNGTGKTSLATELTKEGNLCLKSGEMINNYNIFYYNSDFIRSNFSLKDKVRAIYTLGSINIANQERLEKIKGEKKENKKAIEKEKAAIETGESSLKAAKNASYKLLWNNSEKERSAFSKYVSGLQGNITKLCDKIVAAYDNRTTDPLLDDYDQLLNTLISAFDSDDTDYPLFKYTNITIPNKDDLLNTSLVSSESTEFARAVKALGNISWVKVGHEKYHTNDGKCPYCQRPLPDDFEEQYKSCFDDEYQKAISDIQRFLKDYEYQIGSFIEELKNNTTNAMPSLDLKNYEATLGKLEANYRLNLLTIKDKLEHPDKKFSLLDLSCEITILKDTVSTLNTLINEHKRVIADKKNVKTKCPSYINKYLAHLLENEIIAYEENIKSINDEIATHQTELKRLQDLNTALDKEADELGANAISAEPVVKAINETIAHSGFQGFHLEWNENDKGSYQVVYNAKDKKGNFIPATKLSEGETNFIAFLYFFYMTVNTDEKGTEKDSIVIIDDPVSSMDSQTLFIVSSLVKNLIDRCINSSTIDDAGPIKAMNIAQMFILTHNVYFHANITPEHESNYGAVNFYQIKKNSNQSTVKICTGQNNDGTRYNINPIKNSYAALWHELNEVQTSISACNIIHRILGYYFLNLCGYTNKTLENKLLVENADKFLKDENGNPTEDRFNLVRSFLEYLGHSLNTVGNEVYYVDGVDVQTCKDTFKLVFDAMEQSQHYEMMMKQK